MHSYSNFSNHKVLKIKHHEAFTLAEVLITLTIIGIVAALTIPSLIQSAQNQQYKTAYIKAFRDANIAWLEAARDDTLQARPGWVSDPSNTNNMNIFISKFVIIKQCVYANASECWAPNETAGAMWNLPFVSTSWTAIDNSGRAWVFLDQAGYLLVDTNGLKGPNLYGRDRFRFNSTINGNATVAGIPNTISPMFQDYTSAEVTYCPTPPCYYVSWLTGGT